MYRLPPFFSEADGNSVHPKEVSILLEVITFFFGFLHTLFYHVYILNASGNVSTSQFPRLSRQ